MTQHKLHTSPSPTERKTLDYSRSPTLPISHIQRRIPHARIMCRRSPFTPPHAAAAAVRRAVPQLPTASPLMSSSSAASRQPANKLLLLHCRRRLTLLGGGEARSRARQGARPHRRQDGGRVERVPHWRRAAAHQRRACRRHAGVPDGGGRGNIDADVEQLTATRSPPASTPSCAASR